MRLTLRALAALLAYPSADLQAAAPEITEALRSERALPPARIAPLLTLLRRITESDLLDAQVDYSELFDRSRSLSLHLFEHVHGDDRERGQAMIDLGQQYIDRGFMLDSRELPDFVPVFLEFASCLPPAETREMLGQPAHVFAALEQRLAERQSPYAAVFGALMTLGSGTRAAGEVATPAADEDVEATWEESPVTFGAHEMGGPTGLVAKLRAAKRALRDKIPS